MRRFFLVLFLTLCVWGKLTAHELRPAYLELREGKQGEFSVLWKTPARGEARLSLTPEFGARTESITPVSMRMTDTAALQTWRLRAVEPLRGKAMRIAGLEGTMTDALVRIEFADGTNWTQRLTPGATAAIVPNAPSALEVVDAYLKLGVEHILTGMDHLLFVLALVIITRGGWKTKTVTAFTVAHSITLALATLGFVHVPSKPVEATIALSIVFVAAEIIYLRRGREGITSRAPWIVAFIFGLLHGFGFSGALSEIGLPQGHIPAALLFFNVGVEIGQLLFVAAVLSLIGVLRRIRIRIPRWGELVPPYAIGGLAMFWVIQRVTIF